MPNKRIAMHKIHEILRLRFEVGLSFRQISQCADVSTGAIQKMLKRLEAAGISWPLPEGMSEPHLPVCFILSLTVVLARWRIPTGLKSIWSCVKGVTRHLLWEEYCQRMPVRAYSYSQFCCRYQTWCQSQKRSMRQQHLAGENALSTIVDPQCRLSHLRRVNAGRPRSSWRCWAHQTTPSRRLPIRSRCQTGFSATSGCWSSSVESPKSWFRIT